MGGLGSFDPGQESEGAPAVVEGSAGRGKGKPLAKFISLPGHLSQLEQDGFSVLAGRTVVIERRRRRGGFGTCNIEHVTGAKARSPSNNTGVQTAVRSTQISHNKVMSRDIKGIIISEVKSVQRQATTFLTKQTKQGEYLK